METNRRRLDTPYRELIECALRIAHADVAMELRERGANNAGRDVDWIRQQDGTGGWSGGRGSWCASYVSSVWMRSAGLCQVLLPFRPSRGARRLWRAVGGSGAFYDEPRPGAVVCWRRGTGWQGHVGIVASVDLRPSGLEFYTYEGNRGAFPSGVELRGPYRLRAERESGKLLGFSSLEK